MRIPTLAVLALAAVATGGASAPAPSQCRAGESVAYTCDFGRKVVSVCIAPGRASYRYGPPGAPELDIASTGADGALHRSFVSGQGSGGRQDHLRFSKGDFSYVVHSGVQGSLADAPGKRWSGVVVLQVDAEVANLACRRAGPQQRLKVPPFAPEEPNERFNMWF